MNQRESALSPKSLELTVSIAEVPVLHQGHQDLVAEYLRNARARNTIRGYRSSFQLFAEWCQSHGYSFLPASPETIAAYLTDQAGPRKARGKKGEKASGLKVSTLRHHLSAIQKAHKAAGLPSPTKDSLLISETLKGIASVHGSSKKQKNAIMTEDLRDMLRKVPATLNGMRDRALLLLGFVGAFRRSELAALQVADLQVGSSGVLIRLRKSKTDQAGEGREVAIPLGARPETCPVFALKAWLTAASIEAGSVFRPVSRHGLVAARGLSDHSVNEIVKKYITAIGQDSSAFGGHSLRAGFVTSAARAGEPERKIMRQTGHKSLEMVLSYIRRGNAFTDNAALSLGL